MNQKQPTLKNIPDVSVSIANLKFPTPFILASGILGISYSAMLALEKEGIGGITTKSIGPEPREGYSNPSIIGLENDTFLNAVGLANPGISYFKKEITEIKNKIKIPLVVSIFGNTPKSFAEVAEQAWKAGADAIEMNISCPHAHVSFIGADPNVTFEYVSVVRTSVKCPLFVKLSPNVTNIIDIAKSAEKAGADALVAINTVKAMAIDINLKKPILSNKIGGLSGRAIKPIGLRNVFAIYPEVKIPIIGCGGIFEWQDAIEYFLAGASAVQIGSAFSLGYEILGDMIRGIKNYLRNNDFSSILEIIGLAHEKVVR
ncbi:MAG: dihydroorotate dehydrogenase [Promethearchaeota archaeon]